LDISFEKGFSVITGETGSGKSIILGAISLLLGQRADVKTIKQGASKCIIEAHFNISAYQMQDFFEENQLEYDPEECIFRRELQASGKSRSFINDSPASLSVMKQLGERLIDVHSQHQNLLLNNEGFQLNVLDLLAHNEKAIADYKSAYTLYRKDVEELSKLTELAGKSKTDEDYIRFQLEQLDEAKLVEQEEVELEREAEVLNHSEEIKAGLYKVEQTLAADEGGLLSALKEDVNLLSNLQKVYQPATELSERLNSCYIELKDISHEIADKQEDIEFNPSRLEYINERLNLIYALEQKHRVQSVDELITLAGEYRTRLNAISSFEEQIELLTKQKDADYKKVKELAAGLTKQRTQSAKEVERQMIMRLKPLGMPNVRFSADILPKKEPDITGGDNVSLLFSANKNAPLQDISSVASGGEIARVMLSVKAMIAGATQLPTIIFDEVDTGVSGEIADKMAMIMQEMGTCMQVISITHLPQIAAKGQIHYKVYKEDNETGTISNIRRLKQEERIGEIAQMLSGATLTEVAMDNARELLSLNRNIINKRQ